VGLCSKEGTQKNPGHEAWPGVGRLRVLLVDLYSTMAISINRRRAVDSSLSMIVSANRFAAFRTIL
jgi:hypothetical protein